MAHSNHQQHQQQPILHHGDIKVTEISSPRRHSFSEEDSSQDGSKILVICKDKNSSIPKALLFWLKLQGFHVFVAGTQEKALEYLQQEEFTSAFVDVAQLDGFTVKIFPAEKSVSKEILLFGYSSKDEDETTTMPFSDEKDFARKHGIHYYFPDPLEEKELLEWILQQRKDADSVEKLVKKLDEDIRLNKFHNRDNIVSVENRHHHEISPDYAQKIEEESEKVNSAKSHPHSHNQTSSSSSSPSLSSPTHPKEVKESNSSAFTTIFSFFQSKNPKAVTPKSDK